MFRRSVSVSTLAAITVVLGACGLFERRDIPYQDSGNHPPLDVPEDLDRPHTDDALRIPERSAGGTDIRQPRALPQAPAAAGGAQNALRGDALVVADDVDSTWRRVGLALERLGGEVEILDRDQQARRYRVAVNGTQPTEGFFKRLFRRNERIREEVEVSVEAMAEGTQVRVVGTGPLARTLLQRLQQRLG